MISSIAVGCLILFLTLCTFCIVWKNPSCCRFLYALAITFVVLYFIAIGILLMATGGALEDGIDEACDGKTSSLAKTFRELYSSADSIYWVPAANSGCECEMPSHVISTNYFRSNYTTTASGGITKVQECTQYLVSAYDGYEIDLDTVDDVTKLLDLYGEIEKEYKCSGIWYQQAVYYFYSITAGEPTIQCTNKLKEDQFRDIIGGSGLVYLITGLVLLGIWIIQYGLWCRKKPGTKS